MEELLICPNNHLNNKSSLPQPNSLLHTIYTYSSRYIPIPEKQKTSESQSDSITTFNQPLFNQAKQRIQTQHQHLTQYIDSLQEKFLQVNQSQLDSLNDKHRYYLRKFKKYLNEHKKLSDMYTNLERIVIESQPVQQQIKSINFIRMISSETDKKLQSLKQAVELAEQQKRKNHCQIQNLKDQLNKLKSEYFQKKRQQVRIQTDMQQRDQSTKQRQIQQTMRKIRQQKKQKESSQLQKQILSTKTQYSVQRLSIKQPKTITRTNQQQKNSDLSQLKNLNSINQTYIKKLSQTCEDFKSRKLQDKKKLNSKLVSQTDLQNFRMKSRQESCFRNTEQQELLKNEEIIKQLTLTNRLRQQFHDKKPEELLNLLIKNKKLKGLFAIIEQVKNEQMKNNILERRKINLYRSQTYKNDTTHLIKSFQADNIENAQLIR